MRGQSGPRTVTDFIQIGHERKDNCPYNLSQGHSPRAHRLLPYSHGERRKFVANMGERHFVGTQLQVVSGELAAISKDAIPVTMPIIVTLTPSSDSH